MFSKLVLTVRKYGIAPQAGIREISGVGFIAAYRSARGIINHGEIPVNDNRAANGTINALQKVTRRKSRKNPKGVIK